MIEAYKLRKVVEVPEGVEVNIVDREIQVKKGSLEVKRVLYFPTVEIKKEGNNIVLEPKRFTKKEKKIINTYKVHILNMVIGVQEPYTYKVKICASHFPMTVKVKGKKLEIKNFLGEKVPRIADIVNDVDVKIEGDEIIITSANKEAAGQTAGNFEKATRITNRDRRIFQDGLWIIQKAGKEILG
ncbi:50S ribosomal protein L6 [archaeon]|jgi:large subunit ribosomal protein L6|nr:50S ribosomal protein L6 [archaeon]MBT3730920.1 50S ribosomal protein L6 [archaeon]MBT4669841.1 50S ribosomal protein L6 [archaeon]MBT5029993.1 50S ribosomal protein L6 [archaeon]MBT5288094.1 50S ribosomal protein L6 [archaeon]